MKLLALDTSTDACTAGLLLDGETMERFEVVPRGHAGLILSMMESLLDEAGLSLGQLDALGFGRGPGAFTGVRIAAGVVQGSAFAADLPVVAVSSLAATAQTVVDPPECANVLAAFDARMHEVYWGAYRCDPEGLVTVSGADALAAPAAVAPTGDGEWVGAGSGWERYREELTRRCPGRLRAVHAQALPRGGALARLAAAGLVRGEATAPELALPLYLRDRVAERPSPRRAGS